MAEKRHKRIGKVVKNVNDFRWLFQWFFKLPWPTKVVATVIPSALLVWSYLIHLSWPVAAVLVIVAFAGLLWAAIGIDALWRRVFHKEPALQLALIPHGDQDAEVYLEVINEGDPINLSAQLRIVGLSTRDSFKGYGYKGRWSNTLPSPNRGSWRNPPQTAQEHGHGTEVKVGTGKSHLLRIASVSERDRYNQYTLTLVGIEESVIWDFSPEQNRNLPFMILEIKIFGEGFTKPESHTYKVGPKAFQGPIEMVEVPS